MTPQNRLTAIAGQAITMLRILKALYWKYSERKLPAALLVCAIAAGILLPTKTAFAFPILTTLVITGIAGGVTYFAPSFVLPVLVKIFNWLEAIANTIMTMAGRLLDWSLEFTIRGNAIEQIAAVQTGWEVARDLSNFFFIFILLVIAFATILGVQKYGAKTLLARLIIVALLINFSLFFVKVGIDGSNILALQFYDSMVQGNESLSATIQSGLEVGRAYDIPEGNLNDGKVAAMSFFRIALFLVLAWVFFMGALLFIGRLVGFILLSVLAPFAFLTAILPKTRQHFEKWLSYYVNQLIVAPLYLFIILIAVLITTQGALLQPIAGGDVLDAAHLFNFTVIVFLLLYGLKLVRGFSGQFGDVSVEWGKKGLGFLSGTAIAGGGGEAARQIFGRASRRFVKSDAVQEAAKEKSLRGWAARRLLPIAATGAAASYDVRGVGAVQKGAKKLGVGIGKAKGKGGYEAFVRSQVAKEQKRADVFRSEEARQRYAGDIERGGIIAGRIPKVGRARTIFSTLAGRTGARREFVEKLTRNAREKSARTRLDSLIKEEEAILNKKTPEEATEMIRERQRLESQLESARKQPPSPLTYRLINEAEEKLTDLESEIESLEIPKSPGEEAQKLEEIREEQKKQRRILSDIRQRDEADKKSAQKKRESTAGQITKIIEEQEKQEKGGGEESAPAGGEPKKPNT